MPEPIKRGRRYMPGLDGLRAIAVLGVIAYHVGIDSIPGGLLGVSVFFTLSGYLITDLLLGQATSGGIKLKEFWMARARRLFPALFVMLIVVMAWVTVIGPHQPPDFRSAAATAIVYINNWWLIFRDASYFAQFEAPGPLGHLWSLSVEEQFYIVWPFVVMAGVALLGRGRRASADRTERRKPAPRLLPRLGVMTLGLALTSFILMLVLYKPGIDPSRVYYGTDTRAFELLIGAALATIWPSRMLHTKIAAPARRMIEIFGVVGLTVIALMFLLADEFSPFLYRGGFLLLALGTALVVASMAHPASRLGPIIGCRPMRWIGVRSYGIYLWHFPIIILTTPEGQAGPGIALGALQVAATFGVAALSWKYVEDPIRHGALRRLWAQYRAGEWRRERLSPRLRGGLAGGAVVVVAAMLGFAGVGAAEPKQAVGEVAVAETVNADPDVVERANKVTCKEVIHIGDSTSEGLVSSEFLPDPKQQIASQYARVGARTQHLEVSGARSIHERFQGLPNAQEVAASYKTMGYDGCWVLALGTNETANVSAGSTVTLNERINTMMTTIGPDDPVLWVNTKSLVKDGGPYSAENMQEWNEALVASCSSYPNMRVYDWSSDAKNVWYIPDGIHFTSTGYAARGRLIANALRTAFPAGSEVRADTGDETTGTDDPAPVEETTTAAEPTTTTTDGSATTTAEDSTDSGTEPSADCLVS